VYEYRLLEFFRTRDGGFIRILFVIFFLPPLLRRTVWLLVADCVMKYLVTFDNSWMNMTTDWLLAV